jgi:putative oxidoreductase
MTPKEGCNMRSTIIRPTVFSIRPEPVSVDLVLLFMRAVVGCAFILHGWGKIQDPLHWMGGDSSIPALFQALAAMSEFGGGIALLLGLLTRLGALGICCTMAVAVFMHLFIFGDPFVNTTGGRSFELAAAYFAINLLLVILGPGRFSLDRRFFGTRPADKAAGTSFFSRRWE